MTITIRLLGAFRTGRFKEKTADFPVGTRVDEVIEHLQIPKRALGIVLINGLHAGVSDLLSEGDTLVVLPILAGG